MTTEVAHKSDFLVHETKKWNGATKDHSMLCIWAHTDETAWAEESVDVNVSLHDVVQSDKNNSLRHTRCRCCFNDATLNCFIRIKICSVVSYGGSTSQPLRFSLRATPRVGEQCWFRHIVLVVRM